MIASLEETSFDLIHDAFIDAFSEYEVRMDMPKDKLAEMFAARSFCKEHSLGYFEDGTLVGFLLIGCRKIGEQSVFYDVATGVRRQYQGQKIADRLIGEIKNVMAANKVNRFVLEVLEHNIPAQNLYMKYGFKICRKFNCYEYACVKQEDDNKNKTEIVGRDFQFDNIPINEYCTFVPSWQNSIDSYQNTRNNYQVVSKMENDELVGFGIVHKTNGSILQIGLNPDCRSIENLKKIVDDLCQNTQSNMLKYLNIEENSIMEKLVIDIGFKNRINQFEMEYIID